MSRGGWDMWFVRTVSSSMSGGGGRWWSECGGATRCLRAHLCLAPASGAAPPAPGPHAPPAAPPPAPAPALAAALAPAAFLRPATPRSVEHQTDYIRFELTVVINVLASALLSVHSFLVFKYVYRNKFVPILSMFHRGAGKKAPLKTFTTKL